MVIVTVTDRAGNRASAPVTVTVEDTIAPDVLTQDRTVFLDNNGEANITLSQIDAGSND